MCQHKFVFQSWCKICCFCGLTHPLLKIDTFNSNSAPLFRGYNRRSRFLLKVNKLLGIHGGPNCKDPVWEYLEGNKVFLNTPFDIRNCLRQANLKNKHYDSLRIFCDVFTTFRVPQTDVLEIQTRLLHEFENLYIKWLAYSQECFFSYAWVLRFFLNMLESPLVCYLKPPTCKRRDTKYKDLLKRLGLYNF